jgi:NAD(P)H-dependent flavin oxidoreductase YrpB (nitropropane dioxygenase family)
MDSLPGARNGASLLPPIIQGGMGIGVSDWRLARAVSRAGQLGVVSGTALNTVLVRRLQQGDPGGTMRHALTHCPLRVAAAKILERHYIPGGKAADQPYRLPPLFTLTPSKELIELTIVANFVEVFLAKEGHRGVVGINLLEKVQLPTLPSLFGAMLAGVDCVLMGAGIPRAIPGVLDGFAAWQPVTLDVLVAEALPGEKYSCRFDPADFLEKPTQPLVRPAFLAIVGSSTLATSLARKASGRVDGFVVEGISAGGHNAPPRGGVTLNQRGEPIYGPRDQADLAAVRALDRPFWVAGSCAFPGKLRQARDSGAAGVQIGTAFAFCEESGLDGEVKRAVIAQSTQGTTALLTDARASPTGMPFKVVDLAGTVARDAVYAKRERVCDLGYLRTPYRRADGSVGFRCPAEPVADYEKKGGAAADTNGRKCLCNGLLAAIGHGQVVDRSETEPAIVTAGSDVAEIARFLRPGQSSYRAADVLNFVIEAFRGFSPQLAP